MKKIIALALVLALCFVILCSCGINGNYKAVCKIYSNSILFPGFINGDNTYVVEGKDGEMHLYIAEMASSGYDYIGYYRNDIGTLKKFRLNSSNFDNIIPDGKWAEGFSAEEIRENTKSAWAIIKEGKVNAYFLLQKDESVLYVNMQNELCTSIIKLEKR